MIRKSRLRTVVEIVGVVSVVLSVLFLAIQVQQANKQARMSFALDLQASYNGWHELLIAAPGAADLLMATLPDSAFTPGEIRRRRSLVAYLFNVWATIHKAWEHDLISDLEYEGYANDARTIVANPWAVDIVRDMMDRYPAARDYPIFAPIRDAR
jgi:hypothetical protein